MTATVQDYPGSLETAPWMDDAACRYAEDPDAWFRESGDEARPARRVCQGCPVREPCLRYAIEAYLEGFMLRGIWGGLNTTERKKALRSLHRRRPLS